MMSVYNVYIVCLIGKNKQLKNKKIIKACDDKTWKCDPHEHDGYERPRWVNIAVVGFCIKIF